MTRTPIIAAILTALAAGGVAVAADGPSPSLSLVNAGQEAGESEPDGDADETTTTTIELVSTTTTITLVPETTTSTTMAPTTTTTAPPRTTTTAAPAARPLGLRCAPHDDAKTGDDTHRGGITCVVEGTHERAAKLTLSRDGVKIARTDDMSVTRYTDKDVRPGVTYSYQAHTYAADGTLLQASDAIRATAPEGVEPDRYDGPMVMRCAGSGAKTEDHSAGIGCEWKGVPDGATTLELSRDGEVIVRKDDPTKTGWWDADVRPGQTYTYVLRAYAADGSVLAETEPVVATAGEGA
jgi:hypothetical protein